MSDAEAEKPSSESATPAADRVDALRTAVERTLAATAGSATETRQRAQGLLDDVVRRGQVAREEVARRGEVASARLADAIGELRAADREDLGELRERVAGLERRLAALEVARAEQAEAQVQPESKSSKPLEQGDSGV